MGYVKTLYNPASGTGTEGPAWERERYGQENGSGAFVTGVLARMLDEFVSEYLRGNQSAYNARRPVQFDSGLLEPPA